MDAGSGDNGINISERGLHVGDGENDGNDDKNLLKYCDYAKAPTKARSILPQNKAQLMDPSVNEGIAENASNNPVEGLSSQTVVNRENQDVEMFVTASAPTPVERAKEEVNSYAQPIILEEEQEIKKEILSKSDKEMVEAPVEGRTGTVIVSDPVLGPDVKTQEVQERGKGIECASFKTLDLNLSNNPEITEIHDDPMPSSEPNMEKMVNFGACSTGGEVNVGQYQKNEENDVVQVIHIDDSPVAEMVGSDQAKPKESGEVSYANTENMLTNIGNVDVMPVMQDGFNFTLSEYLGSDICYQMQPDLQPSGMAGVDDSIYSSLGDIGFEVWDQQNGDYERFF